MTKQGTYNTFIKTGKVNWYHHGANHSHHDTTQFCNPIVRREIVRVSEPSSFAINIPDVGYKYKSNVCIVSFSSPFDKYFSCPY